MKNELVEWYARKTRDSKVTSSNPPVNKYLKGLEEEFGLAWW